ncbi:hypothetical protein GP486_001423 [Trichoglossum hirsutum]|uniref:DUF6594 domain-containing protein n=1 Tax=Trichoglossum hirsutum TaxID=265104 RepID=A0A9P8LGP3_9PEZI|nr:hypothetical protein GP486_001423 [Trichoglossum hirsutum]
MSLPSSPTGAPEGSPVQPANRTPTGLDAYHDEKIEPIPIIDKDPMGYPRLAAFMNSDENFKLYRQFGYVHTRVLLHLQYELSSMEATLKNMDGADDRDEDRQLLLRSQDASIHDNPRREKLLKDFRGKLKEYDELLLLTYQLSSLPRPRPRDIESLDNFMSSKRPLVEREAGFINHGEDFVSPTCKPESGRVDDVIEGFLIRHPLWLTKVPH